MQDSVQVSGEVNVVDRVPRPKSLTELAYQELRDGILEGGFAPGRRVSVVSLAAEMGMSRSPVRAAVERLATDGLMTLTPGGAFVPTAGRGDLLDALAVRAPLEGLAARLAAPQLADSDIDVLSSIHAEFDAAVKRGDTRVARKADFQFHQQVQTHCGNECLVEHLERVQARVILATYSTAWSSDQTKAVPEHALILAALSARDGEAAGRAATVHLENLAERVRREWRRRDREESSTA